MQHILKSVEKIGELANMPVCLASVREKLLKYKKPWRIKLNAHVHLLSNRDYLLLASLAVKSGAIETRTMLNAINRRALKNIRWCPKTMQFCA